MLDLYFEAKIAEFVIVFGYLMWRRFVGTNWRPLVAGVIYKPLAELVEEERVEDIVKRVLALGEISGDKKVPDIETVEAVLGGVARPADTVTDAMALYKTKIVARDLNGKSPQQACLWHAIKDRSLRYFVDTMGDQVMADITRDDALEYFGFWNGLLEPEDPNVKPKSAKTASRHFSDIRKLYTEYFKYLGDEDRANPFRYLNFEKN